MSHDIKNLLQAAKTDSLGNVLSDVIVFAEVSHLTELAKWAKAELDGYSPELEKVLGGIPDYRKIMLIFKDAFGRMVIPPDQELLEMMRNFQFKNGINEIESYPGDLVLGIPDVMGHRTIIQRGQLENILRSVRSQLQQKLGRILVESQQAFSRNLGAKSPTKVLIRKRLDKAFPTDPDLDAFLIDCFPGIKQRCTVGMERKAKVNLLLELVDLLEIDARLSEYALSAQQD